MGNKLYDEISIQAIANAIRSKLDTEAVYRVSDMSTAIASIPTGITPTGTMNIPANGDYDVTNYAEAHVAVPEDLSFRDKTIIPDKYNTGCHGYLTPFDLSSDTSGLHYNTPSGNLELKFNTQYSSVIRDVDPSHPIIYRNIDFTAYPQFQFMQCGDCHKEDANYTAGVVIIFENCLFRKVYSNGSFTSADMIQFAFINCTMEYFNVSNCLLMNCLIGNKTFYHTAFGDEVLEDGIGVNDYTTIANSYVMDIEPIVSASGGAHFDGLQCNYEHTDYTLYNVRFECINMPYDPKGGGWTEAVNFEHVTTNLIMANCIINGGGYYATGIKKGSNQTLTDNLIGATYNSACYPSDQVYQLTDGFATTYTDLYVSSVFFDGKDISIVCTNDSSSARTLTVKGYNAQSSSPVTTLTYTVPACPTYNSGWSGITSWDDLPFDKIYKVEHALSFYGINKIECYDGDTKIRTWYVEESAIPVDIYSNLSITSNGTYNTEDKSAVIVNVPSGELPSDMEISSLVTITSDTSSFTVPYDSTRGVAGVVVIPDILQGIAYEMTFVFCKMNFLTGTFNQTYAAFFNDNLTEEQTQINDTVGQVVSVDSSTGLITISAKSGSYRFMAGDTFRVLIIYGGID